MSSNPRFKYEEAFKRNLGFLSKSEQETLRKSKVAIAAAGGAGGAQAHTLARLGVGAFHLADPDFFEMSNFNRQTGAGMATINRKKVDVAAELISGINPEADVKLFYEGVTRDTLESFLEGADVVIDSLDTFCFEERFMLYRAARERGLWVLTAPPLGFGFSLMMFDPKGMTFEDYFGFSPNDGPEDLIVSLIAGIAPGLPVFHYLDPSGLSFGERRLPSVSPAPMMLAGAIATEVVTLLAKKKPLMAAPTMFQFDAMLHMYERKDYRWDKATKEAMRAALRRFQSGA